MKVWLSRQRNGSYMVTAYKPYICEVGRSDHKDVYMKPGDPVGYRHMCEESIKLLWNIELKPLEMTRVWIEGGLLSDDVRGTNN